jgi:hypothetical protein
LEATIHFSFSQPIQALEQLQLQADMQHHLCTLQPQQLSGLLVFNQIRNVYFQVNDFAI